MSPGVLADRVAQAVLAVPGVHDLHGGVLGEVATYLPGRRVTGVRLRDGDTQVHLVLAWGAAVSTTTDAVRTAVAAIVPGTVHVAVEDIAAPGQPVVTP
ncbi:Asp23/Gls24 family envelope stress response protein [Nocardioides zhouii]|uniref:Asp23/Gls24 family envelope stress response protein n=1 Tax=Nocardioides zhouii TaxID=1168729 RepID=A0A4Q2T2V0_9ACTN|nr:Asp23/Gls24 family envelope stress response protein [Nocardioides zhouii]